MKTNALRELEVIVCLSDPMMRRERFYKWVDENVGVIEQSVVIDEMVFMLEGPQKVRAIVEAEMRKLVKKAAQQMWDDNVHEISEFKRPGNHGIEREYRLRLTVLS